MVYQTTAAVVVVEMVYQTTANRKKKRKKKQTKERKGNNPNEISHSKSKFENRNMFTVQGRKQVQSYISFINYSYLPWNLLPFQGGNTSTAFIFKINWELSPLKVFAMAQRLDFYFIIL